jgi:glycosyltransferase involved in cell wall biosynthesis
LKDLPNVHLLGRRSYQALPDYLHNADVGLIPFDSTSYPELVHGIHPLKLYEYLACGLPVVATEWRELTNLASPAALTKTSEQFIEAIRNAVSHPHDKAALRKYAQQADWQTRLDNLIAQLDV